jgi:predicted transcriptional regulator
MKQRIEAHKKSQKSAPSLISSIEKLVEGGKYNTISRIEKKTGMKRTTISGRLSDLERAGKIYKKDESSGNETVYGRTPKNKINKVKSNYNNMRVKCMLKTLKTEYYNELPQPIKNYFDETSCG